jgi:hypothetical protein
MVHFLHLVQEYGTWFEELDRGEKQWSEGDWDFGRLSKMAVRPLPPPSAFLPTYLRTVQPYANIPSFFILSCVRSRSSTNVSFSARLLKIATPITAGLFCGSGG